MSSYLNKMQVSRERAVDKYLADNNIRHEKLERSSGRSCYILIEDKHHGGIILHAADLIEIFKITFEVEAWRDRLLKLNYIEINCNLKENIY